MKGGNTAAKINNNDIRSNLKRKKMWNSKGQELTDYSIRFVGFL